MVGILLLIGSICEELTNPKTNLFKWGLGLYYKNKEIINYLIVGGLTTLVSIGSYALFRVFISNYMVCTVLSWIAAVLFAYITNRVFVFESKDKNVLAEFVKFVSCRLLTLGSEILVMFILVNVLKLNDMISKVLVQFIIVVLNYVLSKILVFRNKENK